MKNSLRFIDVALAGMVLVALAAPTFAVNTPNLGSAARYAVLDSISTDTQAKVDAQGAYNQLVASACNVDMTGQEMNNQRLAPGVYCFNTPTVLNGQLLLDAHGDPNALFVFKMAGTFNMWPDSVVLLFGGAQAQNVFWTVGSSLGFGTSAHTVGTYIAVGNVTFGRGGDNSVFDERGSVSGRLISLAGTVIVPSNVVVGFEQPAPVPYVPPQPGATTSRITVINSDPNFALFVDGFRVTSGSPNLFTPGAHTVSEVNVSPFDYTPPTYSGDCVSNDIVAVVNLNPGEQKTCTMSNIQTLGGISYVPSASAYLPALPNTGGGREYLMLVNIMGLVLITAFLWEELRAV